MTYLLSFPFLTGNLLIPMDISKLILGVLMEDKMEFFVSVTSADYFLYLRIEMIHRIIESFGLERTPRGHLVQPPRSEQGHH